MGIVNKRNAVVGWLVLKGGKRAARKKAQEAVPGARRGGIAAGALAALGGLVFFGRKRRADREGE
ncbi:MAG TPA: hypothetical protein VJ986_12180 [Gaiellaceae bacterium]|nr:hypothetical protein [Gaiellaceae bacterium]